jgi:hypothetical protein
MPGISRRQFIRNASIGAAAVGAVAAVGPSAFGVTTASSAAAASLTSSRLAPESSPGLSAAPGTEVMAHVVDRASGTIAVYSGTKKVTFQDHRVAEALLKAAQ